MCVCINTYKIAKSCVFCSEIVVPCLLIFTENETVYVRIVDYKPSTLPYMY